MSRTKYIAGIPRFELNTLLNLRDSVDFSASEIAKTTPLAASSFSTSLVFLDWRSLGASGSSLGAAVVPIPVAYKLQDGS